MRDEAILFGILLLIIFFIIQIVWIRAKLAAYSTTNLSAELKLSDRIASSCPSGNIMMYGIIIDKTLTSRLNNPVSDEYSIYTSGMTKRKTVLPYICTLPNNGVSGLTVMMTETFSLCVDATLNAFDLVKVIQHMPQVYIMINSKTYLAGVDEVLLDSLRRSNKEFEDKLIINLYAVNSEKNEILDYTKSGCQIKMAPFFGKISLSIPGIVEEMYQQLGIDGIEKTAIANVLGFSLTQATA